MNRGRSEPTGLDSPIASIHPSNALTYMSLGAGLAAVAAALDGSAAVAGACLAAAALADTFDGRFARLFERSRELQAIGMNLDSLSDAVSFGLVPIAAMGILLAAAESAAGLVWWVAAAIYACAALTRLAFFNATGGAAGNDTGFIGLPAPVAALCWSTAFLAPIDVRLAIAVAAATAVAMVAPVRISRPTGVGLIMFALWPITLIAGHLSRI
jgi:phosphatidylserine synthase